MEADASEHQPNLIGSPDRSILQSMKGNGDKSRDDALAGIRLVLEEIRDIKKEQAEDRKQATEDRKQIAEDRKQFAEDRQQAAEDRQQAAADRRRFDDLFRQSVAQAEEHRKEFRETITGIREALVVIGKVGRRIIQTQDKHTGLLVEIRDILKSQRKNGRNGGGH